MNAHLNLTAAALIDRPATASPRPAVRPAIRPLTADPRRILWHLARGRMAFWLDGNDGQLGWVAPEHRGVQWLDKVVVPRKQRSYIFNPNFELRYNTAFEEVLRGCANLARQGKTWISEELLAGYVRLHEMGYAYSAECWQAGELVGGLFGLQIGSFVSADSMFHRVNNASKFAYVRNFMHLKERGFKVVDVNYVSETVARFGGEWLPRWKFEELQRGLMAERRTIVDGGSRPAVPQVMGLKLRGTRVIDAIGRRVAKWWPRKVENPAAMAA